MVPGRGFSIRPHWEVVSPRILMIPPYSSVRLSQSYVRGILKAHLVL
jgi:hypothetical protein